MRSLSHAPAVCLALALIVAAAVGPLAQYSGPSTASQVLSGSYQIATLPPPTLNQGRYAFVTDLGGGPDMVLSDGSNWKHIRQGVLQVVTGSSSITLTPLVSPPILQVTGQALPGLSVVVSTQNLYPGATFRIIFTGTLAALASAGVGVQGVASSLPILPGSWQDVQWTGTSLVKIAGGTL